MAALRGVKTQLTGTGGPAEIFGFESFVIIQYNVHSLLKFEERMERILHELSGKHWDVIVCCETWREETEEIWETKWKHIWYGSGGLRGSRGVGMLLHRRWSHLSFKPLSERLCVLDVRLPDFVVRICGTYMPHSLYSDSDVEAVYAALEGEVVEARGLQYKCVCARDWNAQVGQRSDFDDDGIVGQRGFADRNDRGDMLVQWSTFHGLVIENTFAAAGTEVEAWTYTNGGRRYQLDYILLDRCLHARVADFAVLYSVDIGSDHRPVSLSIHIKVPRKSKPITKHTEKGLNVNKRKYGEALDDKLQSYPWSEKDTWMKAAFFDQVLVEAKADAAEISREVHQE